MTNIKKIEEMKEKIVYLLRQRLNDIGIIDQVKDGTVVVKIGLNDATMSEIVEFLDKDGLKGMINSLSDKEKSILVFGGTRNIKVGDFVKCTGDLPNTPVGNQMKGRVVNAIGQELDGGTEIIRVGNVRKIEIKAPGILARESVKDSLETGIKFLDSMIPIGLGQRELLIGDPKTGKTTTAIDTILNQKGKGLLCVYVVIGQKQSSVLKIIKTLKKNDCFSFTTIVMASAAEAAAMQYLAPFTGTSIGEYFMSKGRDVLIVYDDLSKHAVAYRQMSLLLRRPPGREGYPGDVFYLHSRLLERSAKLKNNRKIIKNHVINGGSLTAFPIIETVDGDISAYIPTNVISITDGQVFFEVNLFNQGIRPAINPGVSVSRVGAAAQSKVMKSLAGSLKLELAQYREIVEYISLGLSLDASTKLLVVKGSRLQSLMIQLKNAPVDILTQIILLYGGLKNYLNDIDLDLIKYFERKLNNVVENGYFSFLFKNTIRLKIFSNLNEYIIFCLKLVLFSKTSISKSC